MGRGVVRAHHLSELSFLCLKNLRVVCTSLAKPLLTGAVLLQGT